MQKLLYDDLERAVCDECLDLQTDASAINNAACILRCIRDSIHAADPSNQITPDALEGVLFLLDECKDSLEMRRSRIFELFDKAGERSE